MRCCGRGRSPPRWRRTAAAPRGASRDELDEPGALLRSSCGATTWCLARSRSSLSGSRLSTMTLIVRAAVSSPEATSRPRPVSRPGLRLRLGPNCTNRRAFQGLRRGASLDPRDALLRAPDAGFAPRHVRRKAAHRGRRADLHPRTDRVVQLPWVREGNSSRSWGTNLGGNLAENAPPCRILQHRPSGSRRDEVWPLHGRLSGG